MSSSQTNSKAGALRRSGDDRHLHLSPILQQIRDDGPAVAPAKTPVAVPVAAVAAPAVQAAANEPAAVAVQPDLQAMLVAAGFRFQGMFWYLLATCLLLTIALSFSVAYSYRQQAQIIEMQTRLQMQEEPGALTRPLARAP